MKRSTLMAVIGGLTLFALAVVFHPSLMPHAANACNWGRPGGQDYAPQGGSTVGPLAKGPGLSKEQAYDVVQQHIRRLNPDLQIGTLNDAGSYFEAQIVGENGEVVELLAVDKQSGRLIPIY